jgi:hypothetical protein
LSLKSVDASNSTFKLLGILPISGGSFEACVSRNQGEAYQKLGDRLYQLILVAIIFGLM